MISGAQAMVECLKREKISTVFGYPGAAIAPFYDCLAASGIRHILTRSEQGAGHAASGFARISGRPGVCIATSGPGATNLFTAIATAYSDSIPLVAITGQVATCQLGRDVFQEVDTTGAVEPFTKYAYLLKSANDIARVFKEAFYIAGTGRKGPVLIDVPVDVQQQMTSFAYPKTVQIRGYRPCAPENGQQIAKAAQAICAAKKPLLCFGGGIFLAGAQKVAKTFCERTQIPAVSTMMGIGVLEQGHPLYFGMLGQSGVKTANTAVNKSDLLILAGARVGDRAITRPAQLENSARIIHIDIDAAEIGKNVGTTIPLQGDAADILSRLLQQDIKGCWQDWTSHLVNLQKRESAQKMPASKPGFVAPRAVVRALCEHLPEDSVYIADVGQNQIWSAKNFSGKCRFLTTGGMGTMGYSIPAAIGAKLADPAKTVVAVCGDGAFQMVMNELATMRQHGVAVKIVLMRNDVLGMINETQGNSFGEYATDLSGSPDYGIIAAAYGMRHACLDTTENIQTAVRAMFAAEEPYLLECAISPNEKTE